MTSSPPPPRVSRALHAAALVAALFALTGSALAQGLTVTLTPSNHNGFAITCFGAKDGQLTANVSGGTPPYTYSWSHGDSTQQVAGLAAGFYRVTVNDADTLSGTAEITLMEPLQLRVDLVPYVYPNAYNISCADCFNGAIQSSVSGGLPPYQYQWNDDVTTAHRQDLGHHVNYELSVTDANGCIARSQILSLTQPERMDWTMEGNSGTDPEQHYIGTVDSTDLVLKSNGQERLRIGADGTIRLPGADEGFIMKGGGGALTVGFAAKPWCFPENPDFTPWYLCGNEVTTGPNGHFLGTVNDQELRIRTNNIERMQITRDGKVGIGTQPPSGAIDGYRLFVEDGIVTRDVLVKVGTWPDYVFAEDYRLMPLQELREFLKRNRHLPGIPSAAELEEHGGVSLGDMQRNLVRTAEEQALYILELEERLERMEQRLEVLEASVR